MSKNRSELSSPGHFKKSYLSTLSRIFCRTALQDLALGRPSKILQDALLHTVTELGLSKNTRLDEAISLIYDFLFIHYRNEYFYKNTVANKVLLGRHSINTTTMFTEFRVRNSIADVLMLNGTSHIYEIKSEFDSLDRLDKQLQDYKSIAEKISIISTNKHMEKLLTLDDPLIGLIELTGYGTLKTVRKATSDLSGLDHQTLFDSLRKHEYMALLRNLNINIPKVANTQIYGECYSLFKQIPISTCYKSFLRALKNRDKTELKKKFILDSPSYFKALCITCPLAKNEMNNIKLSLETEINHYLN